MIISIGEFIKFFRKRHKMSQQQLANILECTTKGLSKMENGLSSPRMYTLKLFEDYFKVKLNRYYQVGNMEILPVASYEKLIEMLYTVGRGDLKQAYKLACEFERSNLEKTDECFLNICYVKARFITGVAEDYQAAVKNCAEGLKFEPYVYFNEDAPDNRPLIIESFMPSLSSLQLINFLGACFLWLKDLKKAELIYSESISALNKLFNEPFLMEFCYKKEDVCYPFAGLCTGLANVYYSQGRFEEALNIIERSLNNIRYFRVSIFMYEQYEIKFKSYCALKRYREALLLLPNVLFYYKSTMHGNVLDIKEEYLQYAPEIKDQVNAVFNMFSAMYAIQYGIGNNADPVMPDPL